MEVQLEINGTDFTKWLAEDGIKYSPLERVKKSIVTTDGTEHRITRTKDKLDVTTLDLLPDSELTAMEIALSARVPALVTYTNKRGVVRSNIEFYSSGISTCAKKVIAGVTYYDAISFSLEEK